MSQVKFSYRDEAYPEAHGKDIWMQREGKQHSSALSPLAQLGCTLDFPKLSLPKQTASPGVVVQTSAKFPTTKGTMGRM